ncbi:MAG TPA: DGQHR domain-containing protein [Terracidiphilus sp.]|jgi:DGQHR domain-containing protein
MSENEWFDFPCLEITQPIGRFYIAVMRFNDLIEVSTSDIIHIDKDERDIETVSGLERPLGKQRVKELREYVNNIDATFPTGVIIAVSEEDADFDPVTKMMSMRRDTSVAKIIDGQHRIEGLRGFNGETFGVNVTIFVEMDPEDQALVFSTINLKQTPVSTSITYDLFSYAKSRSPQKTCHQIARRLNLDPKSPFKDKIMILGVAHDKEKETLTQAAFIKPLQRLIVMENEAMRDRDTLKRGRILPKPPLEQIRTKNLVFRTWFVENADSNIAQTVVNYFTGVQERWPLAWKEKTPGLILNRTTGYNALMRFLPLVMFRLGLDQVHEVESFRKIFEPVTLDDAEFNPEVFKPGSSGQGQLFRRLLSNTGIAENEAWKGQRI